MEAEQNKTESPNVPLKTEASVQAVFYSVLLMLVSLLLPALSFSFDRSMHLGGEVLFLLLMGVMSPAWLLYPLFIAPLFANVLYWVVLLMFWRGKTAAVKTWLRWIWVFAIFGTVAFAVESRPEFGWGALLWFLSFAALTVAVNDRHVSLRQMRLRLAGVTVVAVLSMAAFSAWQWHHANDWERQTYDLPWQAAFTTQALSHLPYQPPPELPPQSRMVLQGDWNGNAEDIALPKQFAYRGWQVQRFDGEQSDVALLQRLPNSAAQPDYQYGVRDGHWFLADAQGNILWQVPRDKMTPLLHSRYHTLWEKQFKQQTLPPEPLVLLVGQETARSDCPITPSAARLPTQWIGWDTRC